MEVQVIVKYKDSTQEAKAFAGSVYTSLKKQFPNLKVQVLYGTGDIDVVKRIDTHYWCDENRVVSCRIFEDNLLRITNPDLWKTMSPQILSTNSNILFFIGELCSK